MYDPMKFKPRINKEKAIAPAGSLLRVWEGTVELAKDNMFSISLYST